ncbi:hypothetical protein QR680_009794 [Steinernema hermaphroditum]|uniref:Transcription factor BTF3 n=1 Tax=Steinernema hermaphroditum TaxID=289476 RepID=A0AA39INM2_9BILA|nr:hypothetical protein QR680_009794 [Steinernema hermaphroditum]
MNPEKLAKLQEAVRTGGPGTQRRKKKVVRRDPGADDQKVKNTLKKLGCAPVGAIDEVNMIKDDGTVLHFSNPKVLAAVAANTFSVAGTPESKQIVEMVSTYPSILNQLGPESLIHLKKLASQDGPVDDEVPELVENFEEASKDEA